MRFVRWKGGWDCANDVLTQIVLADEAVDATSNLTIVIVRLMPHLLILLNYISNIYVLLFMMSSPQWFSSNPNADCQIVTDAVSVAIQVSAILYMVGGLCRLEIVLHPWVDRRSVHDHVCGWCRCMRVDGHSRVRGLCSDLAVMVHTRDEVWGDVKCWVKGREWWQK